MREAPRDHVEVRPRPAHVRRARTLLSFLILINPVLALAAIAIALWRD